MGTDEESTRPALEGGMVNIEASYPVGEIPHIRVDIGVSAIGLDGIWMTAAWIYCLGKVIPVEAKKFADEAYDFLEKQLEEWKQKEEAEA